MIIDHLMTSWEPSKVVLAARIRTCDLTLIWSLLYQLSYASEIA